MTARVVAELDGPLAEAVTGLVLRGISADPLTPPTDCAALRATATG